MSQDKVKTFLGETSIDVRALSCPAEPVSHRGDTQPSPAVPHTELSVTSAPGVHGRINISFTSQKHLTKTLSQLPRAGFIRSIAHFLLSKEGERCNNPLLTQHWQDYLLVCHKIFTSGEATARGVQVCTNVKQAGDTGPSPTQLMESKYRSSGIIRCFAHGKYFNLK